MKVCVIGAGATGLCAIKQGISFGCEVIAFEQTDHIGGTWVYTDEVGKDKYGLDIHSSMYQGLRTNLPKEIMCYPDFPFPEHEESYIKAEDVLQYLQLYAKKFDLEKYVKFEHHILRVRPLLDDSWEVLVKDLKEDNYETYNFDAVLICNGHYNTPNMPFYKGQNEFKGTQFHTHDYRNPVPFKGGKVLIIGAGPSGIDAVLDISKVADIVTWSHHLKKSPITDLGDNVNHKPDVQKLTANGVVFVDGTYQDYTAIIYATGYKYAFPFLSVDCGISCDDNYVHPLYKHCLGINRSSIAIIGLPNYVVPFYLFDFQIRFCLSFMTGRKQLPSKEQMFQELNDEINERKERGLSKKLFHYMGPGVQDKYLAQLSDAADIQPAKPVICKLFAKGLCNLLQNSSDFRKERFRIIDDETFITI